MDSFLSISRFVIRKENVLTPIGYLPRHPGRLLASSINVSHTVPFLLSRSRFGLGPSRSDRVPGLSPSSPLLAMLGWAYESNAVKPPLGGDKENSKGYMRNEMGGCASAKRATR